DEHVTVVSPSRNSEPEAGTHDTGTAPSTTSSAVGSDHVAGVPDGSTDSTVRSLGRLDRVGAVVSPTVTENGTLASLPAESDVLQVTMVVPIGNVEPDCGTQLTMTVSWSSVAATSKVTMLPLALVASTARSGAGPKVGGESRITLTSNTFAAVLPAWSVDRH